ncbi:MAG: alpha/beta fold hydrolase [Candidatus Thorarchaeota archaeon]|nr:alpha/beta fold hydrolase [Candidatus Thorarchaeota archaeon]
MTPQVDGIVRRPDGANVAFLLIHGFGADVDELASLGEELENRGIASFAVRVAGHGTTPEDLSTKTWQDLYDSVLAGLKLVKSWNPSHLFIAGLSMGGVLTLRLAALEEGIDGIVVFSPAIDIGGGVYRLLPILKHIVKFKRVDLSYIPKMYDLPRSKYDRDSLAAAHELLKLGSDSRKKLKDVRIPTLVIQSGADKTIDPSNGQYVFDKIASQNKELHVIEGAEHVITCHPTRNIAYSYVFEFIKKYVAR